MEFEMEITKGHPLAIPDFNQSTAEIADLRVDKILRNETVADAVTFVTCFFNDIILLDAVSTEMLSSIDKNEAFTCLLGILIPL